MKSMKKAGLLALVLALGLALAIPALAAEAEPAFKQYPTIVGIDVVKSVVDGKTKGYIYDARPKRKKYDTGHIPGAISLPDTQFDKNVSKLPADKDALVIFYCGGLKCALSHKSAFKAEKLGYKNIKVFAEGYPVWKKTYGPGPTDDVPAPGAKAEPAFKQYTHIVKTDFVKDVVDGKTIGLVIDARPKKKKYDKGHIPGALSMPTSQFDKMKGLLPADKNALIVFYCGGLKCALSHKSAFMAEKLGYKNIKVYAEGYPVWKKAVGAGPAMAASAAAPAQKGRSLKSGKEEGSVDMMVFQEIVNKKPETVYLIDVRDAGEYAAGHIKGSKNIPVDAMEKKAAELPTDKPIIFVCGTGARSGEAFYMLKDVRPELTEIYYVDGEITFNKDGSYKVTKPK